MNFVRSLPVVPYFYEGRTPRNNQMEENPSCYKSICALLLNHFGRKCN
jgi:hypothetical protein